MAIRAQDPALSPRRHTPIDLRDGRLIVLAKNLRLHFVSLCEATTRQFSTSSRDRMDLGQTIAFAQSKVTSAKGSVIEAATSALASGVISL
jgi:hypothetical protein